MRILDRLVQFDPRSRNFGIRALVADRAPRPYTWKCGAWLDQGKQGACVGFGWAHEIAARPVVSQTNEGLALQIYRRAQQIDEYPGEDYQGTSVIAGVKAAVERGYYAEYRWAFGLADLELAVGYTGPAVLGVNWLTSMFKPDSAGFIHATGGIEGGHCILCIGVSPRLRRFVLHNSWGKDWGLNGECYISYDDMDKLLQAQGEVCVPTKRRKVVL